MSDWTLAFAVQCPSAGRVEAFAHRRLKRYRTATTFATRIETSRETFSYPVDEAVELLKSLAEKLNEIAIRKEIKKWTPSEIQKTKEEMESFKAELRFAHNPYRRDFNLLYDLYYREVGVRPSLEGDFAFETTSDQLKILAKITFLPKDFLKAWPRSPKFKRNGVLEKFLG